LAIVRKPATPFRRLSGGSSEAVVAPAAVNPVVPEDNTGIENSSRAAAGVEGKAVTGFTCGLCLTWFPQGTQHACARAAGVMKRSEAAAPRTAMTAEEIRLLAEAGQA